MQYKQVRGKVFLGNEGNVGMDEATIQLPI